VWYESLKESTKIKFNALYYSLLHVATKDFKRLIHNNDLIKSCKRATPSEWTNYTTSSKVIKIIRDKGPSILYERLTNNLYTENRRPGLGFFFDNSSNKRGKQTIQNQLSIFKSISKQWLDNNTSDNAIRRMLKNHFFTYCNDEEL